MQNIWVVFSQGRQWELSSWNTFGKDPLVLSYNSVPFPRCTLDCRVLPNMLNLEADMLVCGSLLEPHLLLMQFLCVK